jgi:hypothetical protein
MPPYLSNFREDFCIVFEKARKSDFIQKQSTHLSRGNKGIAI